MLIFLESSSTLRVGILTARSRAGWLTCHPGRWLTLSPRATTELAPYLREKYAAEEDENDLDPDEIGYVECQQCRTIVTSGWACPNAACGVRLHRHCASGALSGRQGVCAASINDPDACTQYVASFMRRLLSPRLRALG